MGSQRDIRTICPANRHRSTLQKAEGCDTRIFLISEVSCILIPFASPRQENLRQTGTLPAVKNTNSVYWKDCNIQGMLYSVEWLPLNLRFKRDKNIPVHWLNDYMVRTESGSEEKASVETMAVKLWQGKCYLTWHKVCWQQFSQDYYLFNC